MIDTFIQYWQLNWNNILTITASIIALTTLSIQLYTFYREKEKLMIEQLTETEAYSFSYVLRKPESIAFVGVRIDNISRTPVTISRAYLRDTHGNTYKAAFYLKEHTFDAETGIILYRSSDIGAHHVIPLVRENLFADPHLNCNDSKWGYLTFFGVPAVESGSRTFFLDVYIGKKKTTATVQIAALPQTLRPLHLPRKS